MPAPHELLGITPDADAETIMAAYRAKVLADHPDQGGTGGGIAALKLARDQMLGREPRPSDNSCKVCGGKGWVRTRGFRPERCPKGC